MNYLNNIKCIIWDLDQTLWNGVLEEDGNVTLSEERCKLIECIDKCGVIQTVCSKNEYTKTKEVLVGAGIWDFFIAPMISYQNKGPQIKAFCEAMHFRYENCLFIDDNNMNLQETLYCCEGIHVMQTWSEKEFKEFFCDETKLLQDNSRRRYYRMLEDKWKDREHSQSAIDFLKHSRITISIHKTEKVHFERVYELIKRTNQLNYTKKRISRKDLNELLATDSNEAYCVHAWDRYGDYGIIGFIAFKYGNTEHFLFSCRVLGMGIEQYCYDRFRIDDLKAVGEVAVELKKNAAIDWIEEVENGSFSNRNDYKGKQKILLKGPCDIRSILSYLGNEEICDTEFTYTNDKGIAIEQVNHTIHTVQALIIDSEKNQRVFGELPFYDSGMFSDKIFKKDCYNAICYSIITDSNLGVYRHKESGLCVAFGEYLYPLTEENNWNDYISGTRFSANCDFSLMFLEYFRDEFEFVGRISLEDLRRNLMTICQNIDKNTQLFFITGVEIPYADNTNPNYQDRYEHHKMCRLVAEEVAALFDNVHVLSFSDYVTKQEDFLEHYNHFQKYVYYDMAIDLKYIFQSKGLIDIQTIAY